MDPERIPVIVGVGQVTERPGTAEDVREPVDLIAAAAQKAGQDARAPDLLSRVDTVCVSNLTSWKYADPVGRVAGRIGAHPSRKWYAGLGGCAPQWFVAEVADRIAAGEAEIALVCGAEAFYSQSLLQKLGKSPPWELETECSDVVGDTRYGLTELEERYNWYLLVHVFPFFENALRHHKKQTLQEHERELGEFCAALTRVAKDNPYAWFRVERTPEEITTISPSNRMIAFPYTKLMCSMYNVDQGAAAILTNLRTAKMWNIPQEKHIFPIGSAEASDLWYVTHRDNYHASPAAKAAADIALHQAGTGVDEVDYLDLYSCFPCAPRIARDALGIAPQDSRALTVTGGLPYFGGPGNNYTLHAICRMVEILRTQPGKTGLVHALSWFLHKHAFGIYRSEPAPNGWKRVDPGPFLAEIRSLRTPKVVEAVDGKGTVETYSVIYRGDDPHYGYVIGRTTGNERFLARVEKDPDTLRAMTTREVIGEKGAVRHDPKRDINLFRF
jgi:acetyl-CoA C-acetyltransferase